MGKHFIRRSVSYLLIVVLVMSSVVAMRIQEPAASYSRYVTASSLSIRTKASMQGKVVGTYSQGQKITCYGTSGNWTKVKYNGSYRYVYTKYISSSKTTSTSTISTSSSSTYTRYVTASTLTLREKATVNSTALDEYVRGEKATCYGTSGGWTKVKKNGVSGYVSTNFLSTVKPSTSSSVTGTTVANYALKYVGLKYVWGGESLTKGVDCSGFTKAIYAKYGYSLPHSAKSQRSSGIAVSSSNRKAGDLICYTAKNGVYHVGIYVGNNKVVHASSAKTGVKTSTWNYRSVYCVRRIIY